MNTEAESGATRPKPGAPRTAMVAMERGLGQTPLQRLQRTQHTAAHSAFRPLSCEKMQFCFKLLCLDTLLQQPQEATLWAFVVGHRSFPRSRPHPKPWDLFT